MDKEFYLVVVRIVIIITSIIASFVVLSNSRIHGLASERIKNCKFQEMPDLERTNMCIKIIKEWEEDSLKWYWSR